MNKQVKEKVLNSSVAKQLTDLGVDAEAIFNRIDKMTEELKKDFKPFDPTDGTKRNISNIEHFLSKEAMERWIGIRMLYEVTGKEDRGRMDVLIGVCCSLLVDLMIQFATGKASEYKTGGDFIKDFFAGATKALNKSIDEAYQQDQAEQEQ